MRFTPSQATSKLIYLLIYSDQSESYYYSMAPKVKKHKSDSKDKQKSVYPTKIGEASENGKAAINSILRVAMDKTKDKRPYVSSLLRFDAIAQPTLGNYLERHLSTVRVENPLHNAPARAREELLVNYAEQDEAFRAELISAKLLTNELLKLFQLKKPDYLMMGSSQLVNALKAVALEAYGVDKDEGVASVN